jgi:hypothetical protein
MGLIAELLGWTGLAQELKKKIKQKWMTRCLQGVTCCPPHATFDDHFVTEQMGIAVFGPSHTFFFLPKNTNQSFGKNHFESQNTF